MDDDIGRRGRPSGRLAAAKRRIKSGGMDDVRPIPALMSTAVVAILGASLFTSAELSSPDADVPPGPGPVLTRMPEAAPEPDPWPSNPPQVQLDSLLPPPPPAVAPHPQAEPGPGPGGAGARAAARSAPKSAPVRRQERNAKRQARRAVRDDHDERNERNERVAEATRRSNEATRQSWSWTRAESRDDVQRQARRSACARWDVPQDRCDKAGRQYEAHRPFRRSWP